MKTAWESKKKTKGESVWTTRGRQERMAVGTGNQDRQGINFR